MEGIKRAAVLVGCNYKGTLAELQGCVNDVWGMHAALCGRFNFKEQDIQVLVDTDPHFMSPTGANIRRALRTAIASTARPGDILFFHFSGHGTRLPTHDATSTTPLHYDECIVPCDMNLLTDEDIREVVDLLPQGVTFTIVADACNSGGLIRYEKEQIGDSFTHVATSPISETYASKSVDSYCQPKLEMLKEEGVNSDMGTDDESSVKLRRSLPIPMLIKILKDRSGSNDINISNIRSSIFNLFKEESSIKIRNSTTSSRFLEVKPRISSCDSKNFLQVSLSLREDKYDDQSLLSHNDSFVDVGTRDKAILVSACQAYEKAQDVIMPYSEDTKTVFERNTKTAFGAMSHAILGVLSQLKPNTPITNYNLVMSARKILIQQGNSYQHPGLYCCDDYVNANFILG